MPTVRKAKAPEKVVVLNPDTGELTDLPDDVLPNRKSLQQALVEEAENKRRWLRRATDWTMIGFTENFIWIMISVVMVAAGCILGIFGQPIMERHTQAAQLYKAMQTSIPILNNLEVSGDPGKYAGKLVDVIITPTRGGVFKSGKGLYLTEYESGLSLVIFESAFPVFMEAYGVHGPDGIAAQLIGKTLKARGTIQSRILKDGATRTSMIVSMPSLIQVIPEKP